MHLLFSVKFLTGKKILNHFACINEKNCSLGTFIRQKDSFTVHVNCPENLEDLGYATVIYANEDMYTGEIKNGLRHGKGILNKLTPQKSKKIFETISLKLCSCFFKNCNKYDNLKF